MVVWNAITEMPKRGLLSWFGSRRYKAKPIVHRYETEEIAKYGYEMLRARGCHKPMLLRVIRE